MTSIDNVTDITPRRQYVAAAAQTDFDYPFPIFVDADLVVDVDGVTKTITTDYTVSGTGADTGGTVTFLSAMSGGEIVTLYRDIVSERTTDYQQNGPWSSVAVNDELDRLTLVDQQLQERINRALRIPITAAVDDEDIELTVANWANKYLTFDADGKPTPAALSATTMTQAIIGGLLYPRTATEITAGIIPTDYAYPPGDIRRHGAVSGSDCKQAIQHALDAHRVAIIPEQFTALLSGKLNVAAAGCTIRGQSRYTSILQPSSAAYADDALIQNTAYASGTSYGFAVSDLYFKLFYGSTQFDVMGVDLASMNNSTVRRCRFEGLSGALATRTPTGVRFSAPLAAGAYSNVVRDCDFSYMEHGVLYAAGANHNTVHGGEFILCKWGIHADPSTAVDSMKVIGPRFEGCDVGILEKTTQASLIACRFESNATADIEFKTGSVDCSIVGGLTASSGAVFKNQALAAGLQVYADDLQGVYISHSSSSRATQLIGPNVLAPNGDTDTTVNPTGAGAVAAYLRGGRLCLDNEQWVIFRNAAGTDIYYALKVGSTGILSVGNGPVDVGNTGGADRARIYKPCFVYDVSSALGAIADRAPVYNSDGSLKGYIAIYNGP